METKTVEKTYKYFDLETFEPQTETVKVEYPICGTLAEAHEAINGEDKIIIDAINAYLRSQKLTEAEMAVVTKGGSKSSVLAAAKPFRGMPPFNKIEDRKLQTKAILDVIKQSPALVNSIKLASAELVSGDDASDENDE